MQGRCNSGGGGSGNGLKDNNAILEVTVPTGSIVTATKGNITLIPQIWKKAADNNLDIGVFFIEPSEFDNINSWVITSTDNIQTATQNIMINQATMYHIELSYFLYIFNYGDNTSITGGWQGSYTNLDNNWNISNNRLNVGTATAVGTVNKIDITDYNKLCAIGKGLTHSGSQPCVTFGIYGQRHNTSGIVISTGQAGIGEFYLELDISSLTGTPGYITCRCGNGSTNEWYKVYLAK